MKKFISYFTFVFCVATTLVSCNKEGYGGTKNYGEENDFMMEVNINGKTYKTDDIDYYSGGYSPSDWGEETLLDYSFAFFREQGFEISFGIQFYADYQKLLECPPGKYPYGCYIDENGDAIYLRENLAIEVSYDDPNMWTRFYQGTHNVTSIKKTSTSTHSEAVAIEGIFSVTDEDKGLNIQGKYRIVVP